MEAAAAAKRKFVIALKRCCFDASLPFSAEERRRAYVLYRSYILRQNCNFAAPSCYEEEGTHLLSNPYYTFLVLVGSL